MSAFSLVLRILELCYCTEIEHYRRSRVPFAKQCIEWTGGIQNSIQGRTGRLFLLTNSLLLHYDPLQALECGFRSLS